MGTAAALPELENDSPLAETFNFKGGSGGGIVAFILQSRKPSYSEAGAGGQLLLQDWREPCPAVTATCYPCPHSCGTRGGGQHTWGEGTATLTCSKPQGALAAEQELL